ncbi:MAG: biotin/lipoyl-binding protein [Lachnospiraceae bacterium]|nr:biotin/lipoyl-binding protein [Lachnospiraceae bacterium]
MKKMNICRRVSSVVAACFLGVSILGGCGQVEENVDGPVIEKQTDPITYELAVVAQGTIQKTLKVKCTYTQVKDQTVSFSLSGKQISDVYVEEGDQVEKGQLLAQLSGANKTAQLEALEYQIARNKLLLEHATVNETYDISTLWLKAIYQGNASLSVMEPLVKNIQQNYRYQKEDLQDAIAIDELQLQQLKEEISESYVYADFDGTVTWVKEGLEGTTSVRGEKIMTVIDPTECVFVTELEEYEGLFAEGEAVPMSITFGTGKGDYSLYPHQMDKWGETQTFQLPEDIDVIMEVGVTGTMLLVTEEREDVLYLPSKVIHRADDKAFVYVVSEDGMRQVKWIETGMEGDAETEIVSGLELGEKVVIR